MDERKDLQLVDRETRPAPSETQTYAPASQSEREVPRGEEPTPGGQSTLVKDDATAPLLSHEQAESLRVRWESVQVGFVDEPRRSVEQANQLVGDAIRQLAEGFAAERQSLEQKWAQGEEAASTEDLRLALRRYRSFFERLLHV